MYWRMTLRSLFAITRLAANSSDVRIERARGRRVLSLLDDRMLRDIGLTRGDVLDASSGPLVTDPVQAANARRHAGVGAALGDGGDLLPDGVVGERRVHVAGRVHGAGVEEGGVAGLAHALDHAGENLALEGFLLGLGHAGQHAAVESEQSPRDVVAANRFEEGNDSFVG